MIFLATNNGIVNVDPDDGMRITGRSLEGQSVTAAAGADKFVFAGTRNGLFRSEDRGQTWMEVTPGLRHPHVRWLAVHPERPSQVYCGTEPAAILTTSDNGVNWTECVEVAQLRDRFHWSLPYSPEAGCVRGFAFHQERGYAAVEVGGALVSDDGGRTWQLAGGSDGRPSFASPPEGFVHPDVHSISVHPSSPELVYAPTGGGFYRSSDGGQSWQCYYNCYVRACWVDPLDSDHIVLGPASGVDRGGRIEETRDGGKTWEPAPDGLNVPWPNHMVERFTAVEGGLLAALSNGAVLFRPEKGGTWQSVFEDAGSVNAIA